MESLKRDVCMLFLSFFFRSIEEYRRKNTKDAAMEECQADVTRIPLPLPLLWCRFRRRATPERREAIPTETQEQRKNPRPICGECPVVEMTIHWKHHKCRARVLLDTGCSTPLISKQIVEKMTLPCKRHKQNISISNLTGELVPGGGQEYTIPIMLQHREHYSQEVFEVAPLEPEVDILQPFWWIVQHPPQGE